MSFCFFYFYFFFRDQYNHEADESIASLDPTNTSKITFEAYVRDNYGDNDIRELEKADKTNLGTRETRRVRYFHLSFLFIYVCCFVCFLDVFNG